MTTVQFKKRPETRTLMLHDSHTTPDLERAVGWIKWKARKLGLLESGYHFVIDRDGKVTETRPMALIGAACQGYDMHTIHICLIGGLGEDPMARPTQNRFFHEDNFTEEQWASLWPLIQKLRGFYGPLPLLGHSEAKRNHSTEHGGTCPPVDMADVRDNYHQWVLEQL